MHMFLDKINFYKVIINDCKRASHKRFGWGGRIRTYGTRDQNPWISLSGVISFLI